MIMRDSISTAHFEEGFNKNSLIKQLELTADRIITIRDNHKDCHTGTTAYAKTIVFYEKGSDKYCALVTIIVVVRKKVFTSTWDLMGIDKYIEDLKRMSVALTSKLPYEFSHTATIFGEDRPYQMTLSYNPRTSNALIYTLVRTTGSVNAASCSRSMGIDIINELLQQFTKP